MSAKPSFFAELKRRNVLRAAMLYVGAAWALSQGVAQLLPVFDFPNWVIRWFVIAAMIGFPFAMLFSWFYEWTPHGIQRESEVETDASLTRETGKKMDRWIIAVLSVAVVLLLANTFVLHKDATRSVATAPPGKSIAVLPFENLSDDKASAYFSNGITEEIIDAIAQIPDLKVAARASSFQFHGPDTDLRKAGMALGVANILQGSVQRSGDEVRINVQLIDTRTGFQLWSEKYDRKFANVFEIEDEISRSIASRLRVQLTGGGGQRLVAGGTRDPRAHELYLHALDLIATRGPGLRAAVDALRQAIKLDPDYAQAWGALAEAETLLPSYLLESPSTALSQAESAANSALAIDPNSASAYVALGVVRTARMQWRQADESFRKALALAPGDAEAIDQYAQYLYITGQLPAALAQIDRARSINPLSGIIGAVRAAVLLALHRYEDARTQINAVIAKQPDLVPARDIAAAICIALHRYPEAGAHLRAIATSYGMDGDAKEVLARGAADPAQRAAAVRSLETAPVNSDLRSDPILHAMYLGYLDEDDHALSLLETVSPEHNSSFPQRLWDPAFDRMRNTSRFKAVLAKMGLPYAPTNATTSHDD